MKNQILILLSVLILFSSCSVRKANKSQSTQKNKHNWSAYFDSLFQQYKENQTRVKESSHVFKSDAVLSLTPLVDSNGVAQTASYIEKENGETVREIYLTGGSLNEEKKQQEQKRLVDTLYIKNEKTIVQVKRDTVVIDESKTTIKEVDKFSIGFQVGFYILGGLVLLLGIVLAWMNRQLKTFKKALNTV